MLSIFMPEDNRAGFDAMFVREKKRLATATAVAFPDSSHVVVADGAAMRLYLIHFDLANSEHEVLDQVDTTYGGELAIPDLMDFNGKDSFVTSYYTNGTQSLYTLADGRLSPAQDVVRRKRRFRRNQRFCHGVRFFPYRDDVLCVTDNLNFKVEFIDTIEQKTLFQIHYIPGHNPKDVFFVSPDLMLVFYTMSKLEMTANSSTKGGSRLALYEFDLPGRKAKVLDFVDIPGSFADSIQYRDGVVFASDQSNDRVNVFTLTERRLAFHSSLDDGLDFPHGIGLEATQNLIAITNYGNNSVTIQRLPPSVVSLFAGEQISPFTQVRT